MSKGLHLVSSDAYNAQLRLLPSTGTISEDCYLSLSISAGRRRFPTGALLLRAVRGRAAVVASAFFSCACGILAC
jgi:hypothetical protein